MVLGLSKYLPFGASNLHSHPFGGSPHLLKKSWPVVPACPGLWLPDVNPNKLSLHFPHLEVSEQCFYCCCCVIVYCTYNVINKYEKFLPITY